MLFVYYALKSEMTPKRHIYIYIYIESSNRYLAIPWTNVDLTSVKSRDIYMRAISEVILQPLLTEISLNITYLKFR